MGAVKEAIKEQKVENIKKGVSKGIISVIVLVILAIAGFFAWNMKKEADAKAFAESPEGIAQTAALAARQELEELLSLPVEKLGVSLDKGPSCMTANTFESYYPKNVIDGNKSTAWGRDSFQGSNGTFEFKLQCRRLDHIDIWNGKWGESGSWSDNAKVKEMTIKAVGLDGTENNLGTFTLENKHEISTITFDREAVEARDIETLKIELSGKYGGALFQDLYLTEIEFFGTK